MEKSVLEPLLDLNIGLLNFPEFALNLTSLARVWSTHSSATKAACMNCKIVMVSIYISIILVYVKKKITTKLGKVSL